MTGYSTNEGGNQALELLLRTAGARDGNIPPRPLSVASTVFLGLHDGEPGLASADFEIAGGGYQRQRCWWTIPGNKTCGLGGGWDDDFDRATTSVVFEFMPDCVVRWFGVWDAQSGGNLLFAIQRTLIDGVTASPLTVSSDQALTVPGLGVAIGPY
jgi:hypothetical protein